VPSRAQHPQCASTASRPRAREGPHPADGRAEALGGWIRLRPAISPSFIWGKGAAGTSRGYSIRYRQTSGLGRLGNYSAAPLPDQAPPARFAFSAPSEAARPCRNLLQICFPRLAVSRSKPLLLTNRPPHCMFLPKGLGSPNRTSATVGGNAMSPPMPATERCGRPVLVIVTLSALSWAALVAIVAAAWSAL
jgi:hypothetical protein